MDAADRLLAWRKNRLATSQLKAAQLLLCDPTTLSKIETRKQLPNLILALKIEEVVGIDAGEWARVVVAADPAPSKRKGNSDSDAPGAA